MRSETRLLALAVILWPGISNAQSCGVNASSLAFGTSDPGMAASSVATLTVNCDAALPYRVLLNTGLHSRQFIARAMAASGGTGLLEYNLFIDASHSVVWGDGTGGTVFASGNGIPGIDTLYVYGYIYSGQSPLPGFYSDSVTVIMEW